MAIINGIKGAYLQPVEYGEDQSGAYTIVRAQGTRNEIKQLIPQLRVMHATWTIKEGYTAGADMLEARVPAPTISITEPEVPVDDWETFGEEVEKDILESDIAGIDGLEDKEKKFLRSCIDNGIDPNAPTRVTSSLGIDLYNHIVLGVKSVRIVVPHLRHTRTVSQAWTVPAALTNVGRIISTGTLITSEGVPTNLLFGLPNGTPNRDTTIWRYGWYKKYPTVRIAGGRRVQLEQEWEYGLWSIFLQGAVL